MDEYYDSFGRPLIAIVGIAAQLPSGRYSGDDLDYSTFWDFLLNKGQAYESLFDAAIEPNPFRNLHSQSDLPERGAFLKCMAEFDNIAFGVSNKDARVMPFGARRLIELAFLSILDSGIDSRGKNIGCFISGNNDLEHQDAMDTDGSFSFVPSTMANRISYVLNITGPSLFLDTACSSSLTALHLAISAIQRGDCPAALVGAAQSNRRLTDWKNYLRGGVLSSDGSSKPFNADADGFARGEGAVVIVLKTLEAALRDKDHIYSVVLGSAINSTGSRMPVNVPSGLAHQQCIRTAYEQAGRSPANADYVELHATGTSVGDPIEVNAAGEIFGDKSEVIAGSVKGNIGHLEAAAFLASLVKACLILEKGIIPPNVNIGDLNPNVLWDKHKVSVPSKPRPLGCRSSSGRSLISLSSAGIGGSTGHVVLEAAQAYKDAREPIDFQPTADRPVLYVIGGLSPKAVEQIAQDVVSRSTGSSRSLLDFAVVLSRRARQLPWRTSFTLPLPEPATIPKAILIPRESPPIAFIFSGQGPQNLQMGRQLFSDHPIFRNSILEMDQVHQRVTGVSLLETTGLFQEGGIGKTTLPTTGWPVEITLPALAMVHIALFDLLDAVGVKPSFLIGHSAGETAIVYASGAGSKAMAMEIAIARGKAMTCTERLEGGMAALACDADQALGLIAEVKEKRGSAGVLGMACFNAPRSIAISGSSSLLDDAVTLAKSKGVFAQRIRTMVPGHSVLMQACREEYNALMTDIFSRYGGQHKPKIQVFSTCTDDALVEEFTAEYFWDNAQNPVFFSGAITNLLASQLPSAPLAFVEISPHPVLISSILSQGVSSEAAVCPMRRLSSAELKLGLQCEEAALAEALGQLSVLGVDGLDLTALYGRPDSHDLPISHPLTSRNIPVNKIYSSYPDRSSFTASPLAAPRLKMGSGTHPTLAQHVINGEPILPASAFIELLLEAGAHFLWDIEFKSILSLSGEIPADVRLERAGDVSWSVWSSSPIYGDAVKGMRDREHARGCMDTHAPNTLPLSLDLSALWERLERLDCDDFYKSLKPFANFGPQFQRVLRCSGGPLEALAEIKGLSSDEMMEGYSIHPALLDACLHVTLHTGISQEYNREVYWLPSMLEQFTLYQRNIPSENWFSHIRLREWRPESRFYDIDIVDNSGAPVCSLSSLRLQKHSSNPPPAILKRYDFTFQPTAIRNLMRGPSPSYERPDRNDAQVLYNILDTLALRMISTSLESKPVVGKELSRRRYFDFAQSTVRTRKETPFSPSELKLMKSRWPVYFTITERIGKVHSAIFNSSAPAVDALYSDDLMSRFYHRDNLHKTICEEATNLFVDTVSAIRAPGKRSLRILEVGAGTGLLTHYLIDALKQRHDVIAEYTVSDVSSALANTLARSTSYENVIPKAYDLSKSPEDQGIAIQSYDIIVALHVLHTVPDVKSCLSALHSLLIPGGCLLVVELDGASWRNIPGSLWHDCVFGSFAEWLGYDDGRTHCTMTPAAWKDMLESTGYTNAQTCVEDGGGIDFLFSAQTPVSPNHSEMINSSSPIDQDLYTVVYHYGQEIELQYRLRQLDPRKEQTIYLVALEGRDGDAAMGLVMTLAKEFENWTIRLAIFETETDSRNFSKLISTHSLLYERGETIVFFPRDGCPCVPRVVPLSPPRDTLEAKQVDKAARSQYDLVQAVDNHHLAIKIMSRSNTFASFEGFIGEVIESHHPQISPGQVVAGLTGVPRADSALAIVHAGCVSTISGDHPVPYLAGHVLGIVLGSLALGPSRTTLSDCSASPLRVLIATQNSELSNSISQYFKDFSSVISDTNYENAGQNRRFDVVITDSSTISHFPHLRRWLLRSGTLLQWDVLLQRYVSEDPWMIKYALETGLRLVPSIAKVKSSVIVSPNSPNAMISHSQPGPHSFATVSMFNCNKVYVLLGGIGGLGVHLAVWMYQSGARHIILTSRRGLASLDSSSDGLSLKKLAYLTSRGDLSLRLEACDATNSQATAALLQSIDRPIGGCFLMTLALADALFVNQDEQSFRSVRDSKMTVLDVFAAQVDLKSLDFVVAFSSVAGLLGNVGQANYSSTCTALDGALNRYPNAFSLIVPGILDAGYLIRDGSKDVNRKGLREWGISADALCACIADGILKLRDRDEPFSQYIPDLRWSLVESHIGLPVSCRHLLPRSQYDQPTQASSARISAHDDISDALNVVLTLLDVSEADFDPELPFMAYGLDSLGAARVAADLRPYVAISQMQLLGGINWTQLQTHFIDQGDIGNSSLAGDSSHHADESVAFGIVLASLGVTQGDFSSDIPLVAYGLDSLGASRLAQALRPHVHVTQMQLLGQTSWDDLRASISKDNIPQDLCSIPPDSQPELSETTIVELCGGPGVPLIIIHDLTGSIATLLPLQSHFTTPLWAIQVTSSTPMASLDALITFYHTEIKKKRTHGPYRLATFSASSVLGVMLVQRLEAEGEHVAQLTFIDHFPALWTCEAYDLSDIKLNANRSEAYVPDGIVELGIDAVVDMLRQDPLTTRKALADEIAAAHNGLPSATERAWMSVRVFTTLTKLLVRFLASFQFESDDGEGGVARQRFDRPFLRWIEDVRAPFTLFVASEGIVKTLPPAMREAWADLGAARLGSDVRVVHVEATHFGILGDEVLAGKLQS